MTCRVVGVDELEKSQNPFLPKPGCFIADEDYADHGQMRKLKPQHLGSSRLA